MPEISIVLPSYNGEEYIRESIESVREQTYQDWELIIVDDCSTDRTLEIAREYAARDRRIIVIHNEKNQKLPESLNIGFRMAKGRYLTWTSDDNMYLSHALETMYEYLETHPDDVMTCTGMVLVDKSKTFLRESQPFYSIGMRVYNCVGASFMYRREVINTVGEYDREFFCTEDWDYWIRILQRYGKIGYIPGAFYVYRLQPQSLTCTKRAQVMEVNRKLYRKNLEWILEGISEDKALVVRFYCCLIQCELEDETIMKRLKAIVPELAFERELPAEGKVILYGTGKNGNKIKSALGNRVAAYTKTNLREGETEKDGIPIISLHDAVIMSRDKHYRIIITTGPKHQLAMIETLERMGDIEYSSFVRVAF